MNRPVALAATLTLLATAMLAAPASYAVTEHCPEGGVKTEASGGTQEAINDLVLPAGTLFCVKASNEASGILTADGETTLREYVEQTIGDHDVSYYVVYGLATATPPTPTPPTPTPPTPTPPTPTPPTPTPPPTPAPPTPTPTPTNGETPSPTPPDTATPTPTATPPDTAVGEPGAGGTATSPWLALLALAAGALAFAWALATTRRRA
jgi:hypothetical protein